MTKTTFMKLLVVLAPFLPYDNPAVNGAISKSAKLSIAIHYLLGGNPYDNMLSHGIGHSTVFNSIWSAVRAIHASCNLDIHWPQTYIEQYKIVQEFRN